MLLQALEGPKTRSQVATVVHVPIPTNGWSTRDKYTASFSRSALKYCPYIRNWMVIDGRLTIRPGFTTFATGMTNPVETMVEYAGIGGTSKIFAATAGGIGACGLYDVTSAGAVGAAISSVLNGARWQHTMFATTSGVYLLMANGDDPVRAYDGTVWSLPALTGVTSADIINVAVHKGTVWLVEQSTLNAWYLPAFQIAGVCSKFSLGAFCKKGGYLVAIGSWSYDGGSGPDDLIAFVTSQGEVVIYQGLNPNSTDEWSLVGVFSIDKPLSYRCMTKFGADLVIFTESGPVQLSQVMAQVTERDHMSDPIRDEFIAAVSGARSSFGWEVKLFTKRGWLWANIPKSLSNQFEQYIYNPLMNAWFRFTEMNGLCWVSSGTSLYFGTSGGTTCVWDNGQVDDDGSAVVADIAFAWWNYGTGTSKLFTLMRPHFFADGTVSPIAEMKVEFDESDPSAAAEATTAPEGSEWDVDLWDEATWGGGLAPIREWLTTDNEGTVAAPRIKISTISAQLSMTAVDVAFVPGGIL